jgi:hypothetical protein
MAPKKEISQMLNKRLGFEEDEVDWTKLKTEDLNKIAEVLLDNRKLLRIAIEDEAQKRFNKRFIDLQKIGKELGILDMEKGIIARLLLGEK